MKKISAALTLTALSMAFAANVNAYTTSNFLTGGHNVFEDDSGEYVFRANDQGGMDLVTGQVAVGDYFGGFLDYNIINGTNIDSLGFEFNGLFLSQLTDIGNVGSCGSAGSGGLYNYDCGTFTFGSAGAAAWGGIFGVDLAGMGASLGGIDLSSTIGMFFEDNDNDLDLFTQGYATSLANIVDGDLQLITGLVDGDDFLVSYDSPLDNSEFDPGTNGGVPGVTTLGDYLTNQTVLFEDFPGEVVTDVFSSGDNLVSSLEHHPVQDDTQSSFHYVPEPATLALLGMGLIGMGATRRRKA